MVNRADVHCRPPPPPFPTIDTNTLERARGSTRNRTRSASFPLCTRETAPLASSVICLESFFQFSNGTRVCGKDFLLFLQTHFKHTFSRYQKSRNRTRKNKMIAILNVHANGNLYFLYFSKENSDTIIRNMSIVIV